MLLCDELPQNDTKGVYIRLNGEAPLKKRMSIRENSPLSSPSPPLPSFSLPLFLFLSFFLPVPLPVPPPHFPLLALLYLSLSSLTCIVTSGASQVGLREIVSM